MAILLFLCFFALTAGTSLMQRKCSEFVCDNDIISKAVYLILNSLTGAIVFFLLSGCRIYADSKLLLFALFFAMVCIGNVISGLYAMKYCLAASVTSTQNGGSMVILATLGFLLWGDAVTVPRVVAILVMLAAIYCIFKETKTEAAEAAPLGKRLLFLGAVLIFWVLTTIVSKLFVQYCGETHKNSYFFFTNLFMIAFAGLYVLGYSLKNPFPKALFLHLIHPKRLVFISGNTAVGNLQSLTGLVLLGMVEVTVYSTVSTSLAILSGVAVSALLRQKMTKYTVFSVVLAIIAVVLQAI